LSRASASDLLRPRELAGGLRAEVLAVWFVGGVTIGLPCVLFVLFPRLHAHPLAQLCILGATMMTVCAGGFQVQHGLSDGQTAVFVASFAPVVAVCVALAIPEIRMDWSSAEAWRPLAASVAPRVRPSCGARRVSAASVLAEYVCRIARDGARGTISQRSFGTDAGPFVFWSHTRANPSVETSSREYEHPRVRWSSSGRGGAHKGVATEFYAKGVLNLEWIDETTRVFGRAMLTGIGWRTAWKEFTDGRLLGVAR
jgi:hypothetical protein